MVKQPAVFRRGVRYLVVQTVALLLYDADHGFLQPTIIYRDYNGVPSNTTAPRWILLIYITTPWGAVDLRKIQG